MCGLFGILNINPDRLEAARLALHTMSHRGPDQWNDWMDDFAYLGHRRLSIRDLSEAGRQPFVSENEDVVAIVNGEIYNDSELRNQLGAQHFKSRSDSEIVLHGYRAWGIEKLSACLDGMYAFAVYDRKQRRLYLAKDRWGKKPLFYAVCNGQFIFASEIKAILEYAPELRVFSMDGIRHWIAYRGSRDPSTIFYGVQRVSPATYMEVDNTLNCRSTCYYDLLDVCLGKNELKKSAAVEIQSTLHNALRESVEKRLVADVPVGIQLSGGVDSSMVAGVMSSQRTEGMHSFSVVFSEPEYAWYSEEQYSQYVARKLHLNHHSFGITREMVGEAYREVVHLFDGMLDYPNAIGLYLLNRFSKQYITVSLTGEGADELFGGYTKFRTVAGLSHSSGWTRGMPSSFFQLSFPVRVAVKWVRPLYLQKTYSGWPWSMLEQLNSYVSPQGLQETIGLPNTRLLNSFDREKLGSFELERQTLVLDHMTYLYSLLDRQDRTSMGASIESRLPFLDRTLVEWAMRLDPQVLFDQQENKKPLKALAAELFSAPFAYRPKMGFPMPTTDWLTDPRCFGPMYQAIFNEDFLLYQKVDRNQIMGWLKEKRFDRRLLNYSNSERLYMGWYLMVLRTTQDLFKIREIRG